MNIQAKADSPTPGPWAFKMVPDTPEERAGIYDPTGLFLCHHDAEDAFGCGGSFFEGGFVDGSHDEMLATARLIASAPDLLAALQAFLSGADSGHVSIEVDNAARAAISKATGAAS